jgi:short-subunit dehydrogenase
MKDAMLITGASSGIGFELAKIAARDGQNLILVARSSPSIKKLATDLVEDFGVQVAHYACDLSDILQLEKLVTQIRKDGHSVNTVINNAGVGLYGIFSDNDWDTVQSMISLNVMSLTYLSRAFLPDMKITGHGRIMNVASTAAFIPGPYMAVYYATKAYVLSLSQALSEELSSNNITVTTLCPGPTQSAFERTAKINGTSGLFKGTLPTSKSVAQFGYRAMLRGKRVAVHGLKNRIGTFLVPLLPSKFVTWAVSSASKPRK